MYTVLLLPLPNSTQLNLLCIRPCFLGDQKCAKSSQKRLSSRTTWRAEFRQVTTYFLCTNLFLWTPTPVICRFTGPSHTKDHKHIQAHKHTHKYLHKYTLNGVFLVGIHFLPCLWMLGPSCHKHHGKSNTFNDLMDYKGRGWMIVFCCHNHY